MNYYKFFIGDFAKKTIGVSAFRRGIYRLLLDYYYMTEKALSLDPKAVAEAIGAKSISEIREVTFVLNKFFMMRPDGYYHERCEEEIAIYRERKMKNAENGHKGGRPKKPTVIPEKPNGYENESERFPENNRTVSTVSLTESKGNHYPLPTNHEPLTNNFKEREGAPEIRERWDVEDRAPTIEEIYELASRYRKPEFDRNQNELPRLKDGDTQYLRGAYFNRGPAQLAKDIKLLGDMGWHVTPQQLGRVAHGEITEDSAKPARSNGRKLKEFGSNYHTDPTSAAL